ncbi:MAG: MFS transporter, partial [Ilumatobacteraceae bacterium]
GVKPLCFGKLDAIAFLALSIPCFLFVKGRGNPNPQPVFSLAMMKESTKETLRTLRSGHEHPGLIRFLVGRVFYTDAINTVISIMTLYTVEVAVAEMTVAATMSPHPQRPCRGRRVHLLRPRPCPQRYPSPHQLQQHSDDWRHQGRQETFDHRSPRLVSDRSWVRPFQSCHLQPDHSWPKFVPSEKC